MYEYKGMITNVVDGDTVDAVVDVGFHIRIKERFRLLGINAPEKKKDTLEAGKAAQAYLESLILNQEVVLRTAKDDSFGRWLATIIHNGQDVNRIMIVAGHAVEYKK